MATKYVNLRRWLDSHEVSIDSLGSENVMDACYDALYDELMDKALDSLISNETGKVTTEFIDNLRDISEEQCVRFIKEFLKHYNLDWRALISDSAGAYDYFYEEHETEFEEWLRKQEKLGDEEEMKDKDYYLSDGIDDFLAFAAEYLFGDKRPSIDNIDVSVLDKIDFVVFIENYESSKYDIWDFARDVFLDIVEDEKWFREWAREHYEDNLQDYITPDGYYPLYSYAWEFPASYSTEELNREMYGIGLIFFELNGVTYVSLGAVGMSMMPSLYYAYAIYSDIYIDPEEIAQDIISHGVGYYKYVIGRDRLIELVEHIGYDLKELDRISKEKYEEFDRMLESLKKEVEDGKMDWFEAAIIGLMKINEEPDVSSAKT